MRLAHVCHSLNMGGITTLVATLVELNRECDTVHEIVLLGADAKAVNCISPERVHPQKRSCHSSASLTKVFKDFDALFVHSCSWRVVLAALRARRRCALFQHGLTTESGGYLKRWAKKLWYTVAPRLLVAPVICSTPFARSKMREAGILIPDSAIRLIPFGVRIPDQSLATRSRNVSEDLVRVGMAGRLVPQKRFDRVLESFRSYCGPARFEILIAGDGPERAQLERLANEIMAVSCGRLRAVTFLGQTGDMDAFYADLDLLALPSRGESFGLVVVEAMARGVPAVVFEDVGGVQPLVRDSETGFVCGDVTALLALWANVAANPGLLGELRQRLHDEDRSRYDVRRTRMALDNLAAKELVGGLEVTCNGISG